MTILPQEKDILPWFAQRQESFVDFNLLAVTACWCREQQNSSATRKKRLCLFSCNREHHIDIDFGIGHGLVSYQFVCRDTEVWCHEN